MSDPFWCSPFINWLDDLPAGYALLVCRQRTARQQARVAAVVEVLALLHAYTPRALLSGPAAEQKGAFWVALPQGHLEAANGLLPRLGYTVAVDLAEPDANSDARSIVARWHGVRYRLIPLYREDADALREQAPDRREFLMRNAAGEVVAVRGYRGDGQVYGKRGLPVYDARLLVNLAGAEEGSRLLDPFGGVGGVVLAAREAGARVVSVDHDPMVREGLAALADLHCEADARKLPFAEGRFDAVATEPPYDDTGDNPLEGSMGEMVRALKPAGRLAVLCAGWQAGRLREKAAEYELRLLLESPINRKGLDVHIFAWEKPA